MSRDREDINILLTPNTIVKHFKHEMYRDSDIDTHYLYRIIGVAEDVNNDENLYVIYQGLYSPFKIYAQSFKEFLSEVDHKKYPLAKQKYRFEIYK